ncbi:MAG: hypothetical protein R3A13_08480 [Bdellovibrionota bacterium]
MIACSLLISFLLGTHFGCGLASLALSSVVFYLFFSLDITLSPAGLFLVNLFILSAPIAILLASILIQKFCLPQGMNRTLTGSLLILTFLTLLNSNPALKQLENLIPAVQNSAYPVLLSTAASLFKQILLCSSIIVLAVIGFTLAFEFPFQWLSHIILRDRTERIAGVRLVLALFAFILGFQLIADLCFRFMSPESII